MPRLVSLERSLDTMQAWAASIPETMETMANLQTYLVLDMAIGRGAHTVTSSVKHMPVLSAHQQLLVASLIQEGEAKAQTLLDSLFRRAPSIYNYTPFALALVVRAQKITGPHQPGDWNIKINGSERHTDFHGVSTRLPALARSIKSIPISDNIHTCRSSGPHVLRANTPRDAVRLHTNMMLYIFDERVSPKTVRVF